MSVNGKRVLAPSTDSVPSAHVISSNGLSDSSAENFSKNENLIDKLAHSLSKSKEISVSRNTEDNRDTEFDAQSHAYSIDDEEIDEPPVPIPSTWRKSEQDVKTGKAAEQIRSSAYGFLIGLFFVVPAMMTLTMVQSGNRPYWASITEYARTTYNNWQLSGLFSSPQSNTDTDTPRHLLSDATHTNQPNREGIKQNNNTTFQGTDNSQNLQDLSSLQQENINAERQTALSSQVA